MGNDEKYFAPINAMFSMWLCDGKNIAIRFGEPLIPD